MARQWPYIWVQPSWSETEILTRGVVRGLPVLSWGWAKRHELATRRQLRAMGLRPGGQYPVALLMFRHRKQGLRKVEYAELFLLRQAKPVRPMTPARWVAVHRALEARRTCQRCGKVRDYYVSTLARMCRDCQVETGWLDQLAAAKGYAA